MRAKGRLPAAGPVSPCLGRRREGDTLVRSKEKGRFSKDLRGERDHGKTKRSVASSDVGWPNLARRTARRKKKALPIKRKGQREYTRARIGKAIIGPENGEGCGVPAKKTAENTESFARKLGCNRRRGKEPAERLDTPRPSNEKELALTQGGGGKDTGRRKKETFYPQRLPRQELGRVAVPRGVPLRAAKTGKRVEAWEKAMVFSQKKAPGFSIRRKRKPVFFTSGPRWREDPRAGEEGRGHLRALHRERGVGTRAHRAASTLKGAALLRVL